MRRLFSQCETRLFRMIVLSLAESLVDFLIKTTSSLLVTQLLRI